MDFPLLSGLLAARIQMAFTLGVHILIACFGVGMPLLILFAEWQYIKKDDLGWKTLAQRWSKCFAVLFAVGAVSGTVLSFELGLLWPEFMGTFGSVIGLAFTLEGFAFFVEAIFLGIYLYSWDRLPKKVHWLTGIPIVLSGFASAWFVVTVNAWMNTPTGFKMIDGIVTDVDPIRVIFNSATWTQTTHMLLAAYMVTSFSVAAYYAFLYLQGKKSIYFRRALLLGLISGVILAPIQIGAGDFLAKMVAKTQPVKLAAMEGQFETQAGAPLRIGGIPSEKDRQTYFALEIPKGLSWLAYGDLNATVKGINDFPVEDTPPILIVHLAFQIMVAIGFFLLFLGVWTLYNFIRHRKIITGRAFLWSVVLSGPLSAIAMETGWIVTEVGRQPWIVHGIMRTKDAVTESPGIPWVLLTSILVYTILIVGTLVVLRILAKIPLPSGIEEDIRAS